VRVARRMAARVVVVIGLIGCFASTALADGSVQRSPRVIHVSAHATELGQGADVFAAGEYRLIAQSTGQAPTTGTLDDEQTGQRVRVVAPAGCDFSIMGPTVLIDQCGEAGQPPLEIYRLSSGQLSPLNVAGVPSKIGTAWLELQQTGPLEHSVTTEVFANLATGQVVTNPQRSAGRTYADLSASGLSRTACRPLTVPTSIDGSAEAYVPGSLTFLGSLGIRSNASRTGRVTLQRCGSHAVARVSVGDGFVKNRSIMVWSGPDHGILLRSDHQNSPPLTGRRRAREVRRRRVP
jgi:hypothetical protein